MSDTTTEFDGVQMRVGRHGTFLVSPAALDRVIAKYLPASPNDLRKIVEERTLLDYSDVLSVTEFLFILCEFDYASSPLIRS